MSGDTVTGLALQFTEDNKHCYAYSGKIPVNDTETTLLEFETLSSYIIANIQLEYFDAASDNMKYLVKINNVDVCVGIITGRTENWYNDLQVILPKYSRVKITGINNNATGTRSIGATLTGKVGMPQRVGNLDE
tara:strand:- start:223 stop:624 length:402 start_codon:yes stop_codon:yes gene_type:complete